MTDGLLVCWAAIAAGPRRQAQTLQPLAGGGGPARRGAAASSAHSSHGVCTLHLLIAPGCMAVGQRPGMIIVEKRRDTRYVQHKWFRAQVPDH